MPAYRFEEIAAMVRRGDVAAVDRAISSGWDVNRDDGFSATTALLVACEADRADVVALLLGHGADPNVRHRDNWNCYDSSRSRRVRELLVAHGFDGARRERLGRGLAELRVLGASARVTETWSTTVSGTELYLEYRVCDFPTPAGRADFVATVAGRPEYAATVRRAGHQLRALSISGGSGDMPVEAAITLTLGDYQGDFRVRLFCSATIEGNDGPRTFWLPDWAPDPNPGVHACGPGG